MKSTSCITILLVLLAITKSITFVFASQIPTIDGIIQEGEYSRQIQEPSTDIRIHWYNDDVHLWIGVISPGLGWVAVGFEPESPFHQGANLIIGYVENEQFYINDEYGTNALVHELDENLGGTNNILISAGAESEGETIIEFKIPLDSGDEFDKVLKPNENYTILVAYQAIFDVSTYPHTAAGKISIRTIPEFSKAILIFTIFIITVSILVIKRKYN